LNTLNVAGRSQQMQTETFVKCFVGEDFTEDFELEEDIILTEVNMNVTHSAGGGTQEAHAYFNGTAGTLIGICKCNSGATEPGNHSSVLSFPNCLIKKGTILTGYSNESGTGSGTTSITFIGFKTE